MAKHSSRIVRRIASTETAFVSDESIAQAPTNAHAPSRNPAHHCIWLTFDDGPDPACTPHVLNLLRANRARATFFVIAEKAQKERALIQRLVAEGHAIGNHSLDHRYGQYFRGKKAVLNWVRDAENVIADITGEPTIGFRPPAGVYTPELRASLNELGIPMVLWNVRYFDAVNRWKPSRALRSAMQMQPGSIVLLHDAQAPARRDEFIATLSAFMQALNDRPFDLRALDRTLCLAAAGLS